ncbi:hypothetical protein ACFLQV_02535 [Calditrichota bacterium]
MRFRTYPAQPLILLTAFIMIFTGCSPSTNPSGQVATTDQQTDVSEDFGATISADDEGILALWMETDYLFNPPSSASTAADGDSSKTRFRREMDGLTIDFELTFYDANDNPSPTYDSLTTVRAVRDITIDGTLESLHRTATIHHVDHTEISGIAPHDSIHVLNGSSQREVESTFKAAFRKVQRTFKGEHDMQVTNFTWHRDYDAHPYPFDGIIDARTIMYLNQSGGQGEGTFELALDFSIGFDGTQYAEMRIDDGESFWIDLETGECHTRHP